MDEPFSIIRDNGAIKNNNKNLLGNNLNNRVGFVIYITSICNRMSKKLHALAKISQFMNNHKRRITMKAFIASEIDFCLLVWMFHSRKLNGRVNKLHERVLKKIY